MPFSLALKAELEVLSEAFTAAWMAQDFAAMASFYTDDACLMPPDHGIIRGKQGQKGVRSGSMGVKRGQFTG